MSASGHAGEITPNEALWRGIAAWRGHIAAGQAVAALAELDEVMRGPAQ